MYYRKHEKQQFKIATFKKFCANRYDLKSQDFTQALNEIFVAFQDCKNVQDKLSNFHRTIVSRNLSLADHDLVELFKAMCKDVKINPNQFSEDFFLRPFNAKQYPSSDNPR